MGKEKRQKIELNPVDYNYMDDMPLEGWIWEIVRRGKTFADVYKKMEELFNSFKKMRSNYDLAEESILEIQEDTVIRCYFTYEKFVKSINLDAYLVTNKVDDYIILYPKPQSKYIEIKQRLVIVGLLPIKIFIPYTKLYDHLGGDMTPERFGKYFFQYGIDNLEDNIYIIISKRSRIKDIKEDLFPLLQGRLQQKVYKKARYGGPKPFHYPLQERLQPVKPKVRDDRWKYYLIVYDLKKKYPEISYEKIADVLIDAYPYVKVTKIKSGRKCKEKEDSEQYFTAKTCSNFYKNALALIDGGEYKKYLYL